MIEALIAKYGKRQGLSTAGDKITEWPYEEAQPSKAEILKIVKEYNDLNDYKNKRRIEYPRLEVMLLALIEADEGRPEAMAALQELRAAIKLKYPKPALGRQP